MIFKDMQNIDFREAFLDSKENNFNLNKIEFQQLKDYILSDKCLEDLKKWDNKQFYIEPPYFKQIKKSNSTRRRKIYIFKGHEKMLMQFLSYMLIRKYDYLFSSSIYSYRKNRPIHQCFRTMQKADFYRKNYVLKIDIHEYCENIDQDIALDIIKKYIPDDDSLNAFLAYVLKLNKCYVLEPYKKGGEIRPYKPKSRYEDPYSYQELLKYKLPKRKLLEKNFSIISGLPIGIFVTNMYLLDIDEQMRKNSFMYFRFSDDIVMFCKTWEEAQNNLDKFKKMIEPLKLSLNEEKTTILKPGEAFNFLGCQVQKKNIDVSPVALNKIKQRFKRRTNKILKWVRLKYISKEEGMTYLIYLINKYFYGSIAEDQELNWVRWAFPCITKTDSLKILDHYLQNCIRIVGAATKTSARLKIPYSTLQKLGYKSLVHSYHYGYEILNIEEYMLDFKKMINTKVRTAIKEKKIKQKIK